MTNPTTNPIRIVTWTLCGASPTSDLNGAIKSARCFASQQLVIWTSPRRAEIITAGNVHTREWAWRDDYSAARNAGLDFAAEPMGLSGVRADWACMLDDDEKVICPDPAAFRTWLAALTDAVAVVLVHSADGSHTRERFFRLPARVRFTGRTHEMVIATMDQQAIAPPDLITWSELPKTDEQLRAKFLRDVEMLREDIRENPSHIAAHYYLGATLQALGRHAEALDSFRTHHTLDTWEGGAWSCYRAAECYLSLNQPNRAIDAALAGMARDVGIAELHWIAAIASLQEGRTEQARCWALAAKIHGRGSESERRRVGFRIPRGLTTGPDEILDAVNFAREGGGQQECIRAIVFSKDRPMQLDACLRSLKMHCRDIGAMGVHVLYKATSPEMSRAYGEIAADLPWARLHEERAFEAQTRGLLAGCKYVLFAVDDTVFVRGFSVETMADALAQSAAAIGYSMRLGANCTWCYPTNELQVIPEREPSVPVGTYAHRWFGSEGDWGYPLEVSSSFYRSADILTVLDGKTFTNPNTLEARLALSHQTGRPVLFSRAASLAFSVPANKVQDVYANRAGDDPGLSPSALLSRWQAGYRIDVGALAGHTPSACHEEVAYTFERRDGAIEHDEARARIEPVTRPIHITVTSAARNAYGWAEKCVRSVGSQTFVARDHVYIDDASTDDTHTDAYFASSKVDVRRNEVRRGALANLLPLWHSLPPDEVVVWLDGDDWLCNDHALDIVAKAHASGAWVTYGQFTWSSTGAVGFAAQCGPDPRAEPWRATILRTFRAGLAARIRDEDLRWPDGSYLDLAIDQAIMIPCLEMAGIDRARFIPNVLATYNDASLNSMTAEDKVREADAVRLIRSRERYSRIGAL